MNCPKCNKPATTPAPEYDGNIKYFCYGCKWDSTQSSSLATTFWDYFYNWLFQCPYEIPIIHPLKSTLIYLFATPIACIGVFILSLIPVAACLIAAIAIPLVIPLGVAASATVALKDSIIDYYKDARGRNNKDDER